MIARIYRSLRPGTVAAALLCLAFPLVWCRLFPVFEGEPLRYQLTRIHADDELGLAAEYARAEGKGFRSRNNEQLLAFGVTVETAGRYSIYGISSNRVAQPLEMRVNGRPVSATAFYQKTGSMRRDFERRLIARSVHFEAGESILTVVGTRAVVRTLLVELQREAPIGPLQYVVLALAAAAVLLARRQATTKLRIPPRARLALAGLLYAAGLAGVPAILVVASGGRLAGLGEKDPVKSGDLRLLDARMNSEEHRLELEGKYNVFVMGDSTHFWSLRSRDQMLPALERALPEDVADKVALYGYHGGALNAFDFYLLMNRVVRDRPELVVIPVGLRSFSDWWLHNEGYRFHDMEHYPGPVEFLRAWNLSVGGREISLVGWMLRRADAWLFDGRATHLLRGAKVYFEAERDRLQRRIGDTLLAGWAPVPPGLWDAGAPKYSRWNTRIRSDHPLLDAYLRINDLAARHGVEVLYYTEQVNVEAQRKKGRDIRIRENFAVIEEVIGGGPGVEFLMLSEQNPPEIFADDKDHLTAAGIATVADVLAGEIAGRVRAVGSVSPLRSPPVAAGEKR